MPPRRDGAAPADDVCTVGDMGTQADQSGDRSPDRPPASAALTKWDRVAQAIENVLDSDAKTNRAAKLLGQVLRAWVVTVIGAVVGAVAIVALLASSVPWWAVASAVGLTAAGSGAALTQRRRRRAPTAIPEPRAPS